MKQNTINKPVIVPENGGALVPAFGEKINFKLTAADTGGALSLGLDEVPPGGGPPLHYHLNEDEVFIVQEGRIEYFIENRWVELGPGGVVFAPRLVPHCFRNPGDKPARQWTVFLPSGFENFFERCSAEFAKPSGPDLSRIKAISAEHGIFYMEPGV
jgi:mannose-6-phosphate isomerase-like protein (cupin superfamily)